jgi:aromatic-L-amino-acid decarboxylase
MRWTDFAKWGRKVSDWAADYHRTLRDRPVRAQTAPGAIAAALPAAPPDAAETMEAIFADFENIVMPGITHWQHPRFFAYFPANAAPASVLAEFLVSAIAPQCMLWQTSPAATEMETVMLDWLRQSVGLPEGFSGVIQDSASSATLAAVLTMREKALDWQGNASGLAGQPTLRIYCSREVHTSIDRALWVSGIGEANLRRIPVTGANRGMASEALDAAIREDIEAGFKPAGVIGCIGGTSVGGMDDLSAIVPVAHAHGLYVHVDAAWAGAAMICPEFRHMWKGVEAADSVVFNPHKWLGAQFDCSAHFIRSPDDLVRTLAIQPEFLKTHGAEGIINYSEWSIPLGRRFRALKIWFLIRAYGLDGLRAMIRNHVAWSGELAGRLAAEADFEIVTGPILSLFTFRYLRDGADPDALNLALVQAINDDGRIYLTQTRIGERIAIRFSAGQFDAIEDDVKTAGDVILEIARNLETPQLKTPKEANT